jgi:hypothetical protein
MIKRFLTTICITITIITAQAQTPPEEFFKGLDLMSTDIKQTKKEYIVNSVDQEYLIVRMIRIDDNALSIQTQSLRKIKKDNYDILTCAYLQNTKTVDVNFKINWDMDKYFGGKTVDTDGVYSNIGNPSFDRIGALLITNPDINLKEEIEKISNN